MSRTKNVNRLKTWLSNNGIDTNNTNQSCPESGCGDRCVCKPNEGSGTPKGESVQSGSRPN